MTLIGNKQEVAFELVPVSPSWERRYEPERAAWAGLAIWAGGVNLCRHTLPGSNQIQDHLFVPLGPIADWMVQVFPALRFEERALLFPLSRRLHEDIRRWGDTPPPSGVDEDDWLDEREAWWSRHFMQAGADGAQLPNVAFLRDDEELVVAWAPARFVGADAPILLSPRGRSAVEWPAGVATLDRFVSVVAEWLRDGHAAEAFSWAVAERPLAEALPDLEHALELFTGRDITVLGNLLEAADLEEVLSRLELSKSSSDPAASPQSQMLRDLSPGATRGLASLLVNVGEQAAHEDQDALGRWRRARAIAHDAARSAPKLTESGQQAATEIRRALDLDSQPLPDVGVTLKMAGLTYHHSGTPAVHDRMLVALRQDGSLAAATTTTTRTANVWGQRFEAARALGHVLLDPVRAGAIGAVSGPFAQTSRRIRSGAFAAELLLPESAIEVASAGTLDGAADPTVFARLLNQYGVGARTAAYQLWNRDWLSSPVVRDELIDEFASVGPS